MTTAKPEMTEDLQYLKLLRKALRAIPGSRKQEELKKQIEQRRQELKEGC